MKNAIQHISRFINQLLYTGVKSEDGYGMAYEIYGINRIAFINYLSAMVVLSVFKFLIHLAHAEILLFTSFGYLLTFVFNYYHQYKIGRYNIIFFNITLGFLFSGIYGYQNSLYIVLIVITITSSILNGVRYQIELSWVVSFAFMLFVVLFLYDFSFYQEKFISDYALRWILRGCYGSLLLDVIYMSYLNIKDAKQKEDKLNQSQAELKKRYKELQKNYEDLDQFVYRVSHDLRAPLVSALGLVDICRKETKDTFDFYLTLQEVSLKKLDILIHDILQYSRNAQTTLKISEINFEKKLKEVFDFNAYKDPTERVQRNIVIEQNTPFFNDPLRVKIILNNLISNVLQYQDTQKSLSFIDIKIQVNLKECVITITDNGVGIEEEQLPKVFDMFHRGNIKSAGSGLGLYIIKEVLYKLKGKIDIQSKVGQMTVCTVHLPNLISKTSHLPSIAPQKEETSQVAMRVSSR